MAVNFIELIKKTGCDEAVPAFNIDNLESALAVAEAVKETGKGVIVQTIPRTLRYGGVAVYPAMVKALLDGYDDLYCMHLDHGDGESLASECVKAGFSSVMFDGSALSFEENVQKTRAVKAVLPKGITLEAELGAVGGREETVSAVRYTDPFQATEFVKATKCDSLAVGVGNAHGFYKGTPDIKVDLIEEIRLKTNIPLVLHGASGLCDEVLRDCIKAGIKKINFATELRKAFTDGMKRGLASNENCIDPKIYLAEAVAEIKKTVLAKMAICYKL